ncbi:MAG: lytic murein transglycosylase [bacterium]|nr:lytic murein transglycosylase [bacterium]
MRDITNKKPLILNLSYYRQFRFPLTRILKSAIILLAISFFLFSFVYAPVYNSPSLTFAAQNAQTEQQRQELESQLAQLEKQISDYENTITQYQKQGQTLKGEISTLDSRIAKLNLQIKAANLNLTKLNQQIGDTQAKIGSVEQSINSDKNALSQVLQNIYESENQSLMEIFLTSPRLSDFFGNLNDLALIQDNFQATLSSVIQLKNDLLDQKEQLGLEKSDAEALKAYQASQKQTIQQTQSEKNKILTDTKGKESIYQKLVTETKKTATQVKNQIFELLGGGELTFDKAYTLAKAAQDVTGVRAAFILAILDRESALGQNVGRCAYNQIMKGGTTAMNPKEIPVFLSILQSLNISPDSVQISCPNQDGTYGGAMGPAQFMPSTWNIYKADISNILGRSIANPWNNADAFIAAALYLKDAGATANEKKAAAKYYCGGRWNRYVCLDVYGYNVVKQANEFQQDIDILNAS